jgi:hypothetical protein
LLISLRGGGPSGSLLAMKSPCRGRRIAISLIAGLLTSIVLAIGSRLYHAKFPPQRPRQAYTLQDGETGWDVTVIRGFGRCTMSYNLQPPPGSGWVPIRNSGDPDPIPLLSEPSWARVFRTRYRLGDIGAYGWPVKCLHSFTAIDPKTAKMQIVGSVGIPQGVPLAGVRVPVKPLWAGLALDTLLWGAAWGLPFVASSALRRRNRERRGACIACGYGTGSKGPCPECGATADR